MVIPAEVVVSLFVVAISVVIVADAVGFVKPMMIFVRHNYIGASCNPCVV